MKLGRRGAAGVIEGHAVEVGNTAINRALQGNYVQRIAQAGRMDIKREQVTRVANLANTARRVVVRMRNGGRTKQQHRNECHCDKGCWFDMPRTHAYLALCVRNMHPLESTELSQIVRRNSSTPKLLSTST